MNDDHTTEIILKIDGTTVRRSIIETPVNLVEDLVNSLAGDVVRVSKNIAQSNEGLPLHLLAGKETYLGAFLPSLPITTPWAMERGVLVMQVADKSQTSEHPVMKLDWPTSPGMALLFLCRLYHQNTTTEARDACFLISYDADKQGYFLPLPNIFENAALCMGSFTGRSNNARDAWQLAYNQLANAQWNSDLVGGRLDNLQALFRFKPVKNGKEDKFEAVPVKDWASHCQRCETPIVALGRSLL